MSVAEALGVKDRNVDIRKSKYYAGLQLGDQGTFEPDRMSGENSKRTPERHVNNDWISPILHDSQDPMNEREKQHRIIKEDIYRLREEPDRERTKREEANMKSYDNSRTQFPWDPKSQDYSNPKKRQTDLFLDTLGGPGGTVLRQNGFPPLMDPHFTQQQRQFQQYQTNTRTDGITSNDNEEYRATVADQVSADRDISQHEHTIHDLRKQIDHIKYKTGDAEHGSQYSYRSFDLPATAKLNEARSLDLGSSRGGAGAPVKNLWGKTVTRMPITLSRDDYGESTIKEDIPGKATFDLDFTREESKPYHPWGGQGGGAPLRDKDGYIITHVYGKLGARNYMEGDIRRNKRRQEVLYNELKECARQQKENKEELKRYMKAPQGELAELLLAGRVGKPKRNEITGEIGQNHLPNSDVSKLKMNYQPVPVSQKKMYHDELIKMAEERQYQKQLEKLKEKQESNAHFHNMDSTWGAIGGGAPKHHVIRKKANLTNSLFFPKQGVQHIEDNDYLPPTGLGSFEYYQTPNKSYHKMYAQEDSSRWHPLSNITPRDLRSTARSSHKNLFDLSGDYRMNQGFGGHPLAPYATGGFE